MLAALFKRRSALPIVARAFSSAQLTEDQLEFKRVADDFARTKLLPFSSEWDEKHHFPIETLRSAASLGFGGVYVKDDVGGSALGRADGAVIFESLSYGDVSVTAYLTIHNMVCGVLDTWGNEQQRRTFLPGLVAMDILAAYCLTEPGSGSDAASLKTVAKRENDEYVITGSKAFISGGGVADVYLVMARTGGPGAKGITAFLVGKDMPGLSFGKRERKLGWNAQPTAAVILDGVRVPASNRIGEEGDGFKIAMQALDGGRINIAACSVGGAQFALDAAMEHIAHREQFGKRIADFQATQFKIADMATGLQASRLLVNSAAVSLDKKLATATLEAAMAKRFATDTCFDIANTSLQLFGGYGYLQEYPVERVMRDLRVHSILEGTNEIMRVIIARELLKLQQ